MMDYNVTRVIHCVVCDKRFRDDCGDVFCSSSCEEKWEYAHMECSRCGDECGGDNLNGEGICENCEEELEGDEEDAR